MGFKSFGTIVFLQILYGCTAMQWSSWSACSNDAQGCVKKRSGKDANGWTRKEWNSCAPGDCDAVCMDRKASCKGWAKAGECKRNPIWMKKNCCKSCGGSGAGGDKYGYGPGTSSPSTVLAKECLKAHNFYRSKHGIQLLKYSDTIGTIAQQWANYNARINSMQHTGYKARKGKGENLAVQYGADMSDKEAVWDAVKRWYEEIKDYDFDNHRCADIGGSGLFSKVGHFTQVVWGKTRLVGCGVQRTASKGIYVVGQYYPAGNFGKNFCNDVNRPIR